MPSSSWIRPARRRAWSSARTRLEHGTSRVTIVGPPSGLDTVIVPSNAASRRITPRIPVPGVGVGAAAAVVADHHAQHAVARGSARPRRAGAPACLADVGQALGDREVDRGLDRRRRPPGAGAPSTSTGTAMSRASARTAPSRPRSASTGGWMPRTTERRSPSAALVASRASLTSPAGRLGVGRRTAASAMPRLIDRRPAGPGPRRAGRARSGAARPPSGRRPRRGSR